MADVVVNVDEIEAVGDGDPVWGGSWKVLTPSMRERGGKLGVVEMRLPKGHTTCPFHFHMREDEVFFVLSGRGVLRYGEVLRPIGHSRARGHARPHFRPPGGVTRRGGGWWKRLGG